MAPSTRTPVKILPTLPARPFRLDVPLHSLLKMPAEPHGQTEHETHSCVSLPSPLFPRQPSLSDEIKFTVSIIRQGRPRANESAISPQPSTGKRPGVFQTYVEIVPGALRTLERGGELTVPARLNKLSMFAQRLVPSRPVTRLVAKMSRV
jgi:hypothetical protein